MRCIGTAFLALSLGMVVFSASFCPSQQPSEANRKILNKVTPAYPDLARKMQLRGIVKVEATVTSNGKIKSTKVIGGSPVLAQAAVDAIGKWKWVAAAGETTELIELQFHPE
ncbi:MAG: energy transducer TonB [Acidobacteriota bacterium]|jgi:TonB family protein|nr:energy transducer TonB [Acidobacteriota bacterium]